MKIIFKLFLSLIFLALFVFQACGGNAEILSVGNSAPDFSLKDVYGNKFTLSD